MKRTTNHLVWFPSTNAWWDLHFRIKSQGFKSPTREKSVNDSCILLLKGNPGKKVFHYKHVLLKKIRDHTYLDTILKKYMHYYTWNCDSHTLITSSPVIQPCCGKSIGIGCLRIQHVDVRPLEWRLRILSVFSAGHMVFFFTGRERGSCWGPWNLSTKQPCSDSFQKKQTWGKNVQKQTTQII